MCIWESRVPVTHKTSYHNTQEAPGIFFLDLLGRTPTKRT